MSIRDGITQTVVGRCLARMTEAHIRHPREAQFALGFCQAGPVQQIE